MPSILRNSDIEHKHTFIAKILAICFGVILFIHFLIISFLFSWADWVATLIFSMLFIVPGYLSNAGMVLVGGGKPIDKGKYWKDGRRILGDHKTIGGFIKGPLYIGIPISLGIYLLFFVLWPFIQLIPIEGKTLGIYALYTEIFDYQYYFIGGTFPIGILIIFIRIIFCAYGAAFGDLVGSFLKRRVNIESGAPFWIVDQLDFALGSIFFASIPVMFLPGFYFAPDINIIIFLMILTPSVSIIANTIAYIIGLKDVPW
ncbi:MAG: CDP-archaeol synthase [Candidatus Lokiarchaeota archaeon]|nr:CDP-archaeol synthase [Candidatus Lokiarchaeota archaeon]